MAAQSYFDAHPNAPRPLKPMLLSETLSTNSGMSGAKYDSLLHANTSQEALVQHDEILEQMRFRDEQLKYRIRMIKLVSRVIGLILSITTLAPLTLTLNKFFSTRDTFIDVNGVNRTAWNASTKTWPTYMYFALAVISTAFNLVIVLSYCRGVKQANRANTVSGWFSSTVVVAHVVVWATGAALYRAGKDQGEHARDLWGWSCSLGAAKIQDAFAKEINFGQYCHIQTYSWFSGLVQSGAGVLTAIVYFFAIMRMRLKRQMKKRSTLVGQRYETSRPPRPRSVGY